MYRLALVVLGMFAGLCPLASAQRIIHVDQSVSGGANNGTSWSNAYTSLQTALTSAVAGDAVYVAKGTYRPDDGSGLRTATFQLKSGVSLIGGFAGHGAPNPYARNITGTPSVLSGDIGNPGLKNDNSYHVLNGSGVNSSAVLDGFTIVDGNATGTAPNDVGGALYVSGGSPTIRACRFTNNSAVASGGAVQLVSSNGPHFSDCSFIGNETTSGNGAGVYAFSSTVTFTGSSFVDNYASVSGGGLSTIAGTLSLTACSFLDNSALIQGGGIHAFFTAIVVHDCLFDGNIVINESGAANDGGAGAFLDNVSGRFVRCSFIGNITSDDGAGLMNLNNTPDLISCKFAENYSAAYGGAIFNNRNLRLSNCAFIGNSAFQRGGAIYTVSSGPIVTNCTFSRNKVYASGLGGGVYGTSGSVPVLRNSIFWGNTDSTGSGEAAQVSLQSGTPSINYCCVQGWTGALGGTGNTSYGPQFVDFDGVDNIPGTADDDLHILPGSPCVNAASNSLLPPDTFDLDHDGDTTEPLPVDYDGNRRRVNGFVDMGAFEFPVINHPPGDLNCDGSTNAFDISPFLTSLVDVGAYLDQYPNCDPMLADMDGNGTVNPFDIQPFVSLLVSP